MIPSIYLFDRLDTFSMDDLKKLLPGVSEQRRERVLFFKNELDRKLSLLVYLLLKQGLKDLYGITENPIFTFGRYGKPILRDYPEIHFNFSHCGKAAVCVIADEPVGIDVEEIQPFDDETARTIFHSDEYRWIINSAEPEKRFSELWTQKESFIKYRGIGLNDDELPGLLKHAENCSFQTMAGLNKKYIYTLCGQKNIAAQVCII